MVERFLRRRNIHVAVHNVAAGASIRAFDAAPAWLMKP
jgi:hypothetical protein